MTVAADCELEVLSQIGLSSPKSESEKIARALGVLKTKFMCAQNFKLEDVLAVTGNSQKERKWLRTLLSKLVVRGYLYRPAKKKYAKTYESLANWLAVVSAKVDRIEKLG